MKKLLFLLLSVLATVALCFGGVGCNRSGDSSDSIQQPSQKLENAFGAVLEGAELENFTFFTEAIGVDNEARQEVLDILEESGVELADKALAVLDLALMSGEAKVQPNGKVKVTVPAFLEDSITEYKVYHLLDNDAIEELAAEYKDGNITFETSSFSYFVIATATTFNATQYYETHSFENVNVWVTVGDNLTVEDAYEQETHEHVFSTEYQMDDIEHWFVCECGEISERVAHDFELITDPSTCTVPGMMRSTCKQCGYTNNANDLPLADHTFGEWTETQAATCTENGEEQRSCLECGETESKEIPALGHDIVVVPAVAPTCTEDGKEAGEYCNNCDYKVDSKEIPALGHEFGDWTETKAATCTEEGEEQRVCSICGETETWVIGMLKHDIVVIPGAEATCTEDGVENGEYCNNCDYKVVGEVIPALGHDIEVTKEIAPTCLEAGKGSYEKCTRCDYKAGGEEIPALGHDIVIVSAVAPTCTQDGKEAGEHCTRCAYQEGGDVIPATGHDIVTILGVAATCTEDGVADSEYCNNCDYEAGGDVIPATGHDIVTVSAKEPTCTEDGIEESKYCNNCDYKVDGAVIPAFGHSFGEWVETKAPTTEAKGEAQRECLICGEVETKEIPALVAHEFGEWMETKPATCGEEGEEQRVCSTCGETETKTIPATGDHTFGEWTEVKAPTLEEEGEEQRVCSVCGETEIYYISKLQGYTVIVSGGTVNRVGENLNQSSIYVAEDEIVTVKANTYEGYTFFQWNSDCGDIIPTETFDLRVQRNTTFTICFKEALAYGEWILETERTCEQDGRYYREDVNTGIREYIIIPAMGHEMCYEDQILVEATCMTSGIAYNECYVCGYKETFETGKADHTFGDYEIIVEANGSKVGQRARTCMVCGETQTKEYIKAVYPQGNLKITFDSDDRQGVMTSDRNEIHWMLGENEYCYYVMRDRSGHSSGTYLHFFFYYKDEGANSPVYMMKKTGDDTINSMTLKNQYGSYGWGLATYVDSFDEYMKFIDQNNGRSDNGLNSTSLYDMYRRWEERFNEAGGIPNGFYVDGTTEYLGYTCTIWSNDNFYYYVNEDNCCLLYGGLGYNRQYETVEKIEEITEIPYGAVDINSVNYTTISIKYGDGADSSFSDDDYFDIESIHDEVSIHEYSYISKREKVTGWEVQLTDGSWVKIEGLEKVGGIWGYTDDGLKTYKRILDEYFDGNLEEVYIRAIIEPADMPVTVKVTNGYIYAESTNWGSENVFPAAYEIEVNPEYEYNVQDFGKWLVTIDGVTTEYTDYTLELTLPDSGLVLIECILIDVEPNYVTINVVGPGKVNKSSCYVQNGDTLELIASPNPGKIFVGWYVVGLYYTGEGEDIPMMLSMDEGDVVIDTDYSQYGECFGNKYRYVFKIDWPYEPVVITAVFEDYTVPTEGYYDVTIEDGFVASQNWNSLLVTALRLYQEDQINFFERTAETVTGWDVTEDQDGTFVTTPIEDSWGGHWIMYNTTITARM